jgi:alanine racemase
MKKLPTWLEIDLDALTGNLEEIRRFVSQDVRILLTVKADAYGLGAVQVAKSADGLVDMLGVATVDEAMELERAGVRTKILILSPILIKEIPFVVASGFGTTVNSLDVARRISEQAAGENGVIEVHVEVDTGMGRTGLYPDEALELIKKLEGMPSLHLGGVFTHFPVSDTDPEFTRGQVQKFNALVERLREAGIGVPLIHSANSAAIPAIEESHMGMVRPGLLVYGHLRKELSSPIPVRPVVSWKSRLVQIRRIPKGATISYGRTYTTRRETLMGIVPVGYGHGYASRLSNRGRIIAGGEQVPILGRVTMDMTMIDLTDVSADVSIGDEVVLLGRQGDASISVDDLARWGGTIPYEVLCGISKRVPRTYFRAGKLESFKNLLGVIPNHVSG